MSKDILRESVLSAAPLWVRGTALRLSGLAAGTYLYLLTHLTGPNLISIKNTDCGLSRAQSPLQTCFEMSDGNVLPRVLAEAQVGQNAPTLGRQFHELS